MESIEKEFDEPSVMELVVYNMKQAILMSMCYENHYFIWGVPCGPTLEMVDSYQRNIQGICWGDYDGDPANY